MRMIRSIICVGLAMVAMAVCTSMPAVAVPINPGIHSGAIVGKEHPAPVAINVLDQAVLPVTDLPQVHGRDVDRSSGTADRLTFAASSFNPPAYQHIDPHIRC